MEKRNVAGRTREIQLLYSAQMSSWSWEDLSFLIDIHQSSEGLG